MLIRMYRTPFLHTNVIKLKESIEKIALYAYNNSCIPQMGVGRETIINKTIEY